MKAQATKRIKAYTAAFYTICVKGTKLVTILAFLLGAYTAESRECPAPWRGINNSENCDLLSTNGDSIRAGFYPENAAVPFRGNVIYLEGLADSMLNHAPLFQMISNLGFRVVAFDYPGQGGSSGSMNSVRIDSIMDLARLTFLTYAREDARLPTTIIGWSTGGLAAYKLINEGNFRRVILIAPGIAPNLLIGEGFPTFEISLRTLTRNSFVNQTNPHVDPIQPSSPLKVPLFSANLIMESKASQNWKISPHVKGLALLSGGKDAYVDSIKTFAVLRKNAPQFKVRQFMGALHELDNELPEVSDNLKKMVAEFLLQP